MVRFEKRDATVRRRGTRVKLGRKDLARLKRGKPKKLERETP